MSSTRRPPFPIFRNEPPFTSRKLSPARGTVDNALLTTDSNMVGRQRALPPHVDALAAQILARLDGATGAMRREASIGPGSTTNGSRAKLTRTLTGSIAGSVGVEFNQGIVNR